MERGKKRGFQLTQALFSLFLEKLLNQGFAFGRELGEGDLQLQRVAFATTFGEIVGDGPELAFCLVDQTIHRA